jgi:TPR repeat protein
MLADQNWDRGHLRKALELFKAAASAGDRSALLNVGFFYDKGLGVRRNATSAVRWYKKAYRCGNASAAHNIGIIWRDRQKHQRALAWFQRATKLGDDSSNLGIAQYHLQIKDEPRRAIPFLQRVIRSEKVSESEKETAESLLKEAKETRRNRV